MDDYNGEHAAATGSAAGPVAAPEAYTLARTGARVFRC